MAPINVVLADDHPVVLRGLEEILRAEGDFRVLAQCKDGEEALRAVRHHRPDLLVLDMRMPRKNGLAVLREMRTDKLPTRVVLLVAELDDEELLEATRLGVGGVVLKEMAPRLLLQCLRKVHAGQPWIERTSAARAFEKLLRREAGAHDIARVLTGREVEVVKMVSRGLRNKAIAVRLSIGEGTVKTHLHNIYEKLHITSRTELILYCKDKGL
ncbi:MAG TPA: response regulator transcription factor [Methylomirabilota bacterium]|jgi:two-component system nitrate/nitrite response regulator NarL|nr:response regulator transcription factor [Methylomirabilota bacterium]